MSLFLRTQDFAVSKEAFELHYDSETDMLVTQPQPENATPYYESDDYISHTDSKRGWIDKLYQRIKQRNLKNKIQLIDKQAVISKFLLDLGAGTGDFVTAANLNGFTAVGIEPNAKARARAHEKGTTLLEKTTQLQQEKFGIITLWHVLEHLPNLNAQIQELNNFLEDEGVLVVAVPNYKSFDARFYKKHWAAYDVPRHLWHFSRKAIQHIFESHRMEVVQTSPMIFDSFYVSLLSEKYKGNKWGVFRAFLVGLWSNIAATFTKEHSSIIYLIKKTK
nr:class I SAM-dependent methyltransferase [Allomuricauda sp.]